MKPEDIARLAKVKNVPAMRPETAKALQRCVNKAAPLKILEIGTGIGFSGALMLEAAAGARLTTIELDEKRLNEAKANFVACGFIDRVETLFGDASEIVPCIREQYGFILLDGPKGHYAELMPYLTDILCPGGTLFADNVGYMGMVSGGEYPVHKHRTIVTNMREFLRLLEADTQFITEVNPVEDGYAIAVKGL